MALKQAHFNMIEQQIRTWDVLDQQVLDLLGDVDRGDFVPEGYRDLAYADIAVPLDHGQVMMHPKIEARMLQALDLHPTDVTLEVGTGSAYLTVLLANVTRHVYSVDIFPEFSRQADERLAIYEIENVTLETGDGASGWERHGPYDVIAITGSLPMLPESFARSLNRGGRLFAIVGDAPVMEAVLIRRVGQDEWSREVLFETELPALINAPQPTRFVF
jgi:protein-L-isoaspartate(D-aspartate) O-methyltransferase